MTRRAFVPGGTERRRRFAPLLPVFLAVAAAVLTWQRGDASSAGQPAPPSPNQASSSTAVITLPPVTIAAPAELRRRVDRFVTSVIVRPTDESLMRWDMPVCPVVEGLPRMFAEFIQARISQIALLAHAPLAGKSCQPNFYVFATPEPEQLLKNLLAHNPRMYGTRNGMGAIEDFLHSRRPVRVWYNSKPGCPGAISSAGQAPFQLRCSDSLDSINLHLIYGDVRSISTVFIVIDVNRANTASIRELADYVAMIGLADVSLDADAGKVPTILRLFQYPKHPPQGLTAWDRALLYSLYNTSQSSTFQMSQMETTVTNRITAPRNLDDTSSSASNPTIPRWANEVLPPRDAGSAHQRTYWLRIGAEQGVAAAQYGEGVRYVLGQGVPQDYVKAAQLFRKAAEQGDARAQLDLGGLYNSGLGVPQDYTKAARWFSKAAERGNANAQSSLGVAYANGQGVPQDYAKAIHWYHMAAEQGDIAAQFNLGAMYAKGRGVPQDYARAIYWYRMAAEQGNIAAQYELGAMYVLSHGGQHYAAAVQWFRKAAGHGNADAQRGLGSAYARGEGVPRDYARAAQWFRKAAEQGDAHAQFMLGELYDSGRGVRRDATRAYKWWILAEAGSSPGDDAYNWSLNEMKESASRITADQLARAHREASEWLAAHRSAN